MAVQNQRLPQQQQQLQQQKHGKKQHEVMKKKPTFKTTTTTTTRATVTESTPILIATTEYNNDNNNSTYNPAMPFNNSNNNSNGTTTTTAAQATTNGTGPRVSFNRDVHVKRIGKHPNELTNYETTNLQPLQSIAETYHQLPADLSADHIRKEAALVLNQAASHSSKADKGDNIPTFKVRTKHPQKFNSLPNRRKRAPAKPVTRSNSDAATLKKISKRPSIFNIFNRKSDTNISQLERDPRFEDSGGRRLVRSKSDVGSTYDKEAPTPAPSKLRKVLREPKNTATTTTTTTTTTQLSPIIENTKKEDYFAEQFNRERRKSDAITDREKHDSGLAELLERSKEQAKLDGNLIGRNPISSGIREKILTLQSKSNENMHSSQLPAEKLPLTKGVTVNGMVKRLSMERFSPPPTISGPAFSYIRPNEGITYAQLDMNEDQHRKDHLRTTKYDIRTPVRDVLSPERTLNRTSVDRTDFVTSHNIKNNYKTQLYTNGINGINGVKGINGISSNNNNNNNKNSRTIIESRDSFSPPTVGPTTIRISSSHSPSPWHQLSPRNLSDEDEGLGIETRKYYDDEVPKTRSKSPTEPPIVPVIRSLTPTREHNFESRAYYSPRRDGPQDDLGYRRARLESRILTRRFGDTAARVHQQQQQQQKQQNGYQMNEMSPERNRDIHEESRNHRYLSPEREKYGPRFHRPEKIEVLNKYSPERSHLDIISPTTTKATTTTKTTSANISNLPKTEKTSRYRHTKYYDDGHGGVKEVYERETQFDADGKPHVRESRHRERLDSLDKRVHSSVERPILNDYEPKSIDSQFTSTDQYRSSPENMKRYDYNAERSATMGTQQRLGSDEHWHSSLKRDKMQQRSFDKGDSGIENDFRKESFNGDITSRWRKRTTYDDIKASEALLKKERRHTEQQYNTHRKDNLVYRERSIDDGSHFDPHLDKYPPPTTSNTLRRKDQQSQTQGQETLKRTKKLGGFEKVKQLFTGGNSGGNAINGSGGGSGSSGSSTATTKKELGHHSRANSTKSNNTAQTLPKDNKDRYMVKEEEMRSRYREHHGGNLHNENMREPKSNDISARRRLSTPKASPMLLKRTSSDKTKKESPLAKPVKTSWFKSLDRRAKTKSKEKLNVSVNGQSESKSMKRIKTTRTSSVPPNATKNLRFFGDTDLDSNPPTITKANTNPKTRSSVSTTALSRSKNYSHSAHHLDRINDNSPPQKDYRQNLSATNSRYKSSSLQNLEKGGGNDEIDFRKRRHYSRSRELDDISESGSETEDQQKRPNGGISSARTLSRERLDRTQRYDEHAYRRSNDRQQTPVKSSTTNGGETHSSTQRRSAHYPIGPPKPARSVERRILSSYSRERERFPAESSGTEGESSLHSQRSVVYLHATTVGAIPQPYQLRRRSASREDIRSNKLRNNQQPPIQPMTRTVSRSVSMLAPWKPKLVTEGYEINYSQEQNKQMSTLPRKAHQNGGSSSTMTRANKKPEKLKARDEPSALRNGDMRRIK